MAQNYRQLLEDESPSWLLTGAGGILMRGIGSAKDALLWRLRQAIMTRFPGYGTASAVGLLGAERQLPRARGETLADYAERIRLAWETWTDAGTALGILTQFRIAGYTDVLLATQNGLLYSMDGSGLHKRTLDAGSWLFQHTDDTYWSRYIVLFPDPLPSWWISGGVPASSSDEANLIRTILKKWKPGHMKTDGVLIATCDETWGYYPAGGTWGDAGDWGDCTAWTRWAP